jgi:hypothetical protein
MIQQIIPINEIETEHLSEVKVSMLEMGSPIIKAVWVECWNAWVALEGSHRIAAALELGLSVGIEEVEYSDALLTDLGIEDGAYSGMTVEDHVDGAYDSAHLMVEIDIV